MMLIKLIAEPSKDRLDRRYIRRGIHLFCVWMACYHVAIPRSLVASHMVVSVSEALLSLQL